MNRRELIAGMIVTPLVLCTSLVVAEPKSVLCEFKRHTSMMEHPDDQSPLVVECPYHAHLTDAENVAEWTQGWGNTPPVRVRIGRLNAA